MNLKQLLTHITVLLSLLCSQVVFGWWNEEWPYRMPVSIDTSPVGAGIEETLTQQVVLLRLHSGNFEDFFLVKEDLSDLRFVAGDDQTPLRHHVEKFDLLNQLLFVWVEVSQITGALNSEKIWMYYGNAQAVVNEDAGGAFRVEDIGVYHFADAGLPQDATNYGNHAELSTATINEASLIGQGLQFDGAQSLILSDNGSMAFNPQGGFSASMWIKPAEVITEGVVFARGDASNAISLALSNSGIVAEVLVNGSEQQTAPALLQPGIWQHVAINVSNVEVQLYLNGVLAAKTPLSLSTLDTSTVLGTGFNGEAGFVGDIDEVRLTNLAQSADFFKMLFVNQGIDNRLLAVAGAEQLGDAHGGGHGGGHFGVIFSSVFSEGGPIIEQVVIIICILMAILAFLIIVLKAMQISAARSVTQAFLKAYQTTEQGAGFAALSSAEQQYGKSPLFQIYKTAVDQVALRQQSPAVGANSVGLTDRAILAIRSTMDSTMVRLRQKLDSLVVMLTIAISGGPFIGLLGTVTGVMTTFGAIAATGDVNIAAIAPGMAAALLATVAGLAVAIPALFGYNYLGSRIKEMTADMAVFADELQARIAEEFGS